MKDEIKEKLLKEDNFLEDAIIDRTKILEKRKGTLDEKIHEDTLKFLISIKELHIKSLKKVIEETSKAKDEEFDKILDELDKYVDGSDWDIGHHEAIEEIKQRRKEDLEEETKNDNNK